jgi:hypothetical protein
VKLTGVDLARDIEVEVVFLEFVEFLEGGAVGVLIDGGSFR